VNIAFDYKKDLLIAGKQRIDLAEFRSFMVHKFETIVRGHYIKSIVKGKEVIPTYDWFTIYQRAHHSGIVNEFLLSRQ
jgi:hypothetical protein